MPALSTDFLQQLEQRFGLVGESLPMATTMAKLVQVAPTDLTVLLTGETGTGKEVFAQSLHAMSMRKRYPFVSVNCGAIPETLLESELFGAEKGAYTGADEKRKGFFEAADRGTIFLDEIGEMPIGTQVKLLRILESGEFSRLGSSTVQQVDVRVIAATNRDLQYEVKQGRFRQDLFYRLNSVNIHLPPLRQHPTDIPRLVEFFGTRASAKAGYVYEGIDDEALRLLEMQPWPGNVRELRNVVETVIALERGKKITARMVEPYLNPEPEFPQSSTALVRMSEVPSTPDSIDATMLYKSMLQLTADVSEMKNVLRHLLSMTFEPQQTNGYTVGDESAASNGHTPKSMIGDDELNLERIEKVAIELALRKAQGKRREAAKLLGISERTLYRKIDEFGLN